MTVDGALVISHDSNALRIFGIDKDINELTLTDFLALRHINSKRYPSHSLEDVLSCNIAPILLHCKITGKPIDDLLTLLHYFKYEDNVVIGVQNTEDLYRVKRFDTSVKTLAFMEKLDDYEIFIKGKTDIIRLWEQWVDPLLVKEIHDKGCKVWVMANSPNSRGVGYTTEKNMTQWSNMGIDGVLIDDVVWVNNIL